MTRHLFFVFILYQKQSYKKKGKKANHVMGKGAGVFQKTIKKKIGDPTLRDCNVDTPA